jgi:hypothetical protein
MKMRLPLLFLIAMPSASFAETAIMCGNLQKIAQNEKNAAVHVDFTNEPVRSKNEIKFFNILGKEQQVTSAKTVKGITFVKVNEQTYGFSRRIPGTCDGEQTFKASVQPQDKILDCICFED